MMDASKHRVVIVGGGFAGLRAAHALRNAPVRVTLIDRRNFHLFQPFQYRDRGSMAVIGRSAAVAQIGSWKLHGFPAWLAWLFVHVVYLVEFQNRLLVTIQWGWNYFTRNRSACLITHPTRSQADNGDVDCPSRTNRTLAPIRRCEQRFSSV